VPGRLEAQATIRIIAPGFSPEKVAITVPLLRILMPSFFFPFKQRVISRNTESVGHFFVACFSQVLLNIVFITGLLGGWIGNFPVSYLCFFILFGGFVQLIGHLVAYQRLAFHLLILP